jgi:transcriptional regulator with XRE-family HTH domain
LSSIQFSLLARFRVDVSSKPIRMATRSPKPFGDFVQRTRQEKGLSCKDVEKQSRRFGKPIAGSYVNRIENNPALKPTAVALKALAHGLGIPVEEVLARAVGLVDPAGKSEELQLLSRFKELSPEKRDFVLDIVDMLYSKEPPRKTPKRKST